MSAELFNIRFNRRRSGPLGRLMAIPILILFVIAVIWMFSTAIDHVEDTNGADTSIATITEMDIVNNNYGSRNLTTTTNLGGVRFHSKKYTGVQEIFYQNYLTETTVYLSVSDYTVTEGNFRIAVIHENELIAMLSPDDDASVYCFENIKGRISFRLVGESAAFSFRMTKAEYNQFFHN